MENPRNFFPEKQMRPTRLLTAFVVAAAACGGDKATGPTQPVVAGTWTLSTVNGGGLPAVLQSANPKFEVLDDRYTFNADGTYSELGHTRTTSGATVTTSASSEIGTWNQTGTTVQLNPTSAGVSPYAVSISGKSLTVTSGTYTFVYAR